MPQSQEDLLDTIRRLVALGSSPNEHEAKLASAKAAEMMAKHNIAMAELHASGDTEREGWVSKDVWTGTRQAWVIDFVTPIIAEFFFVRPIHVRRENPDRSRFTAIQFFGQPSNVDVAVHVFEFLCRTFKDLAVRHRIPLKEVRLYYAGAYTGFSDKMRADRQRMDAEARAANPSKPGQCTALAPISMALAALKKELDAALYQHHPDLRSAKMSPIKGSTDMDSYGRGVRDGQNIDLRPGISSNSNQPRIGSRS